MVQLGHGELYAQLRTPLQAIVTNEHCRREMSAILNQAASLANAHGAGVAVGLFAVFAGVTAWNTGALMLNVGKMCKAADRQVFNGQIKAIDGQRKSLVRHFVRTTHLMLYLYMFDLTNTTIADTLKIIQDYKDQIEKNKRATFIVGGCSLAVATGGVAAMMLSLIHI